MPGAVAAGGRAVSVLVAGVPLRVRLLIVACCAFAVAAGVICLACGVAARAGLSRQAGQQLRAYAGLLASRPFTVMPAGPGPGGTGGTRFVVEVVSARRLVLRTSAGHRPGPDVADMPARAGQLATVPADAGGGRWLVLTQPVHYRAQRILFTYGSDGFFLDVTSTARPGAAGNLVVGLDLRSVGLAAQAITIRCAAVSAAVLLIIALALLALIRWLLRPLARMRGVAAGVAVGGLTSQVPGGQRGHLSDDLARSLIGVLSLLEDSRLAADASRYRSDRMRRAVAGTCDELRRPISVIRGAARYCAEHRPLATGELDQLVDRVAAEAERMDALVGELVRTTAQASPESGGE